MTRKQLRRILVLLLALVVLAAGIYATFSLAVHAGSCAEKCSLCLSLAKLREGLRVFEPSVTLLALLLPLCFAARELLSKQTASTLIVLKARLNN